MQMFSERLKELRKAQGYTTAQMAEICGVSLRSYQRYESGEIKPTYQNLMVIADLFDVSLDYLLCRDGFIERHSKLH